MKEIFGREHEQNLLTDFLGRVKTGHREILAIEGQAGIGKSRLLEEAAHRAERNGFTIRRLSSIGGEVSGATHILPDINQSDTPGLIVVDDAEKVPVTAFGTLIRTCLQSPGAPAGVLFTRGSRNHGLEANQPDDEVGGPTPSSLIELAPLRNEAVRALAEELVGRRPGPGLLNVVSCASGNPRLIVELIRGLAEEERIGRHGELLQLTPGRLPQRIHASVTSHLRRLSDDSVQLLRVGTVLGRVFQLSQAATMLNTTTAALLPALDEALALGILTFTDEGVTFQQSIVWRAIYESIPERILTILQHDARNVMSAHEPTTPVRGLVSLGLLGQAPGMQKFSRENSTDLVGSVRTLLASGYLESAVLLAHSALNEELSVRESMALKALGMDVFVMSGWPDALGTYRAPTKFLREKNVDRFRGPLADESARARHQARTVVSKLATAGSLAHTVTAATALSTLEWNEGNVAEAVRWGREAVGHAMTAAPLAARRYPLLMLTWRLAALGEIREAEALIALVRQDVHREDSAILQPAVDIVHAELLLRAGALDAARTRAKVGLEAASARSLDALVAWALSVSCHVALRCGDLATATQSLKLFRDFEHCLVPSAIVRRQWLELLLQFEQDGPQKAAMLLATTHADLPLTRPLLLEEPGAAAWLVRFSRTVGDRELAESALRIVEKLAADNPGVTTVTFAAVHARSLYECNAEGLARAAAGHRDAWAKRCADDDLSVLLAERRIEDEPPPPTPPLPAGSWPARETVGQVTITDKPVSRPVSALTRGWHELGETERTIAALVANGLTNRQVAQEVFLSPHTVNYYLRRIYRRLNIRSRIELARYIHSREDLIEPKDNEHCTDS